jgi:replicative DNA helicase
MHTNGNSPRAETPLAPGSATAPSAPSAPLSIEPLATPQLVRLGDLLAEVERDAERRHQANSQGIPVGPVTGLGRLDRELGGALAPGLHILHAPPGAGKTAFALQVAATCGCPSLYLTCEMSPLELVRRTASRVTGTFLGKFKSGELTAPEVVSQVQRAAAACPDLALLDATREYVSAGTLYATAEALKEQAKAEHVLIVVDSVHSWADACPSGATEYETLNSALTALRSIAGTLSCPVLIVAERNRAAMQSGGQSAGAGTRKLEYGAETMFDLEPSKDPYDANGQKPVKLTLAKNRHGSPGEQVNLLFEGRCQRYAEDARGRY